MGIRGECLVKWMRSSSRTLFGDSRTSLAVKSWSPISVQPLNGKFCVLPSSLFFFSHLNGWRYRGGYVETREGPAKKKTAFWGRVHHLRRPYASHLSPRRLLSPTLRQCILHNGKGSIQCSPGSWPLFVPSAKLHSDFCHHSLLPVTHTCWAASDAALASRRWMLDWWPIQACWGVCQN